MFEKSVTVGRVITTTDHHVKFFFFIVANQTQIIFNFIFLLFLFVVVVVVYFIVVNQEVLGFYIVLGWLIGSVTGLLILVSEDVVDQVGTAIVTIVLFKGILIRYFC